MFIDFKKDINTHEELEIELKRLGIKLPPYRCAVIALMFDKDNRIVLQRRGIDSRDEVGMLEDIGGAIEDTDITFKDGMKREILEEVGSDIEYTIDELVGASLISKYDSRSKSNVNWMFLLYKCTYMDGELKINEPGKCDGYEFYKYSEIPRDKVAKSTLSFWDYYYKEKDV